MTRTEQSGQLLFADCAVIGQSNRADHVTRSLLAGSEADSMVTWCDRPMDIQKFVCRKAKLSQS